jgi:hypothetical protein
MDIDQVAAELRRITAHIGPLNAEAVSSASTILSLPRYAEAIDPPKALAADLKKIIAGLPGEMTKPARLLFSLSEPGTNIDHRKKTSGVTGSAWMWLRTAILQRIAVAILSEPEESSTPLLEPSGFSVEVMSVSTSFRTPGALLGLPAVQLQWHVDRVHPNARVFTFSFDAHYPLFDWKVGKHKRALEADVDQVSAVHMDTSHNRHFFAIGLGDPPADPLGFCEDIGVALTLKPSGKQLEFLEHTVTHPMKSLGFHVVFPKLRQECELIEFESDAPDAPIVSTRICRPIAERFYTVSALAKPVIGRRYRLTWEPQEPHLLTRLLRR